MWSFFSFLLSIEKRHSTADGFVLRPWCNLCPYAEIAACHCYTIFLCACIITDFECENQQPSLNTFTSFQPIPSFHNLLQSITIYYNFFTTYSFPPFSLYTFPPSEPTEAVKGKRKKYCSHVMKKEPIWKTVFLSTKSALWIFSDTFSPLTGAVFLIQST